MPDAEKLTLVNTLRLETLDNDDTLLSYLYDFVNRTVKMAPPTDNKEWAERLVQPFIELAARYESSPEYDVKRSLWRGVLRGAFLNPQGDADAERDLFARHTMLVVIARAVAETLRPPDRQAGSRERLRDDLTEGFAAWLLDAAGADGADALDALISEVNNYEWQAPNRDILKNLYHAVIPRNIRHDFGEYYTPDWLARAVCEEVMDAAWRRKTISMAVSGELEGPAVLDPSCGSGTFLFHATQLLLETAGRHPRPGGKPGGPSRGRKRAGSRDGLAPGGGGAFQNHQDAGLWPLGRTLRRFCRRGHGSSLRQPTVGNPAQPRHLAVRRDGRDSPRTNRITRYGCRPAC